MKKKSKPIINVISNWAALFLNIVAGFILTPIMIHFIGKTGYGFWTLIISFIGYYGIFETALIPAITHYIALFIGKKAPESVNETASTAIIIFSIIGFAIILISFFVAAPLANLMKISAENNTMFVHVVWILGVTTALKFPSCVFGSIICAKERWVAFNFSVIVRVLIRAVLMVIFLFLGAGIYGLAYAMLISTIVEFIVGFIIYRKYAPDIKIMLRSAKFKILRQIIFFASLMMVIKLSNLIRFNLDSFVIGKMIGIDDVAIYRIAALLMTYVGSLIFSAMKILDPRFSRLSGAGEEKTLKDLFLNSLSVSSFFSFGFILLTFVLGGKFILFWVGQDFKEAIPVLWILLAGYAFELPQTPAGSLLKSVNKHYILAIVQMLEAVANLIISILLAPKYGIVGVAFGTAIPLVVSKLIIQPIYVSKIFKISLIQYFKPILIHGSIAAGIIIVSFNIGKVIGDNLLSNINTILYLIIVGAIIGSIYMGISLILMKKENRNFLLSFIPGFKNKLKNVQ